MSYTFQILFSGLCAFVPDTDIDTTPPSHVDVLLVNTDHADKQHLKFPHDDDDHFTLLKYDLGDTTGGSSTVYADHDSKAFWTLQGEQLTIDVQKRLPGGGTQTSAPRVFTLGDLSALPRMDKIFPLAKDLHPGALGGNPTRIKARLRLDQGTLHQHTIGDYQGQNITVQFVPLPPGGVAVTQTLAVKAALTVELNDDEEVVIHSQAFKPGFSTTDPDVRSVVLNPKPGGVVEVKVMNLCCSYYMEKVKFPAEVPRQDTDFEFFYLLARDFLTFVNHAQFPIPVPIAYQSVPPPPPLPGGGGDTARCNMALFNQ